MAYNPLEDISDIELPRLRTAIPGPRSTELWGRLGNFHSSKNASAGAHLTHLVLKMGRGAVVADVDDNLFIDMSAGTTVTNLGHCPPEVTRALQDQLELLMHYYDWPTEPKVQFYEALAPFMPAELQTFQMYTTGTEAVEAAIRAAKSYTKKYETISMYNAYHGRTLGSMSLMGVGQKEGFGPFPPGAMRSPNANSYRCSFGLTRDSCEVACAKFIDQVYAQSSEGKLAAVIVEPIQGGGGIISHPPEFLKYMREFCDRTGALLIFDEILCGVGRTGRMWAFENSGVVPDILVAGKGLGSGYPMSLIATRREIMEAPPYGKPLAGATTFAGGNLACAAGVATLGLLQDGSLFEHVRQVGKAVWQALLEMKEQHRLIGDVRGEGLLLGVEFVSDRETKEPISTELAHKLLHSLTRRGVLTSSAVSVLRLTPPLVISETLALRALELLDEALTEIEAEDLVRN